jgi:hypothetical protein
MPDDELTPREVGILAGYEWVRLHARSGPRTSDGDLAALTDTGLVSAETRETVLAAGMRERLDASKDPDAEEAFWGGFVHGARAFVVEVKTGGTEN